MTALSQHHAIATPKTSRVIFGLAKRSLRNMLRKPQFLAPLLLFPTQFLAVNVGGLERTTTLPGFPHVGGFLDFQLAAALTQSLLLGGVSTGIASALEIESGFFDRLVSAPIPRATIVFGRLLATAIVAIGQVCWFLGIGLIFGAKITSGIPGVLVVCLLAIVAGIGFGAIGIALALKAKNASLVQGIFPLVFVVLFLSSAFFPTDLLQQPAQTIARYNPLSWIAEGMRNPIINQLSASTIFKGLAGGLLISSVAITLSLRSLRGRLQRT